MKNGRGTQRESLGPGNTISGNVNFIYRHWGAMDDLRTESAIIRSMLFEVTCEKILAQNTEQACQEIYLFKMICSELLWEIGYSGYGGCTKAPPERKAPESLPSCCHCTTSGLSGEKRGLWLQTHLQKQSQPCPVAIHPVSWPGESCQLAIPETQIAISREIITSSPSQPGQEGLSIDSNMKIFN